MSTVPLYEVLVNVRHPEGVVSEDYRVSVCTEAQLGPFLVRTLHSARKDFAPQVAIEALIGLAHPPTATTKGD